MGKNRLKSNKGYMVVSCGGIGIGFGGCSEYFKEYNDAIGCAMGWINNILIETVNRFIPNEVIVYKNKSKDDDAHGSKKEDVIFYWRNYEPSF